MSRRLGGINEIHVDVRVIAATNKNIPAALASGELRQDLYYRFNVIEILMPPLRDRAEDIPLLADHFLSRFAVKYGKKKQRFSKHALEVLAGFGWPGNVRELRNVVERLVVTCPLKTIGVERLPSLLTSRDRPGASVTIPIGSSFEEAERKIMIHTLASVRNNKSAAARILGLNRKTLQMKLRRMSLGAAVPPPGGGVT